MSAKSGLSSGKTAAALGLHRFGFGPVVETIAAIAADPRGALLADLERPGAGQIDAANADVERQGSARSFRFSHRAPGRAEACVTAAKASDRKRRSSFANGSIAWRCERLASSEATAAAAN